MKKAGTPRRPTEAGEEARAAALEALAVAVTIHDEAGVVTYANPAARRRYGEADAELAGANCAALIADHDRRCPHQAALGENRSVLFEDVAGALAVTITPLVEAGAVTGYVREARDLRAEKQFEAMLGEAERLATLGEVLAGVAHDVGTPLNIISGYAEYLLHRAKEDEPGRKELSTMLQQARRIAEMMRLVVGMAKPAQGVVEPLLPEQFLQDTLGLVRQRLKKRGVAVEWLVEGAPPVMYTEAARLGQLLLTLAFQIAGRMDGGSLLVRACQDAARDRAVELVFEARDRAGERVDLAGLVADLRGAAGAFRPGVTLAREILAEQRLEARGEGDAQGREALVLRLGDGLGR